MVPQLLEGNSDPSPRVCGANRGASWCFLGQLARALIPERKGPLAQGNVAPLPGSRETSALGFMGPRAAVGQAASPAQRGWAPPMAARAQGCPPAQVRNNYNRTPPQQIGPRLRNQPADPGPHRLPPPPPSQLRPPPAVRPKTNRPKEDQG
ncbi:atherin-like [Penaeus monodon]|uniref:atherin-like n=1 Tax=Penaeus monodon TaxID=6687 RepID=UPI0018A733C9|nr:atherin-like [Penaeus monodon]